MILTSFQPEFISILRRLKDLEIVTLSPQFAKVLVDTDIPAKTIHESGNDRLYSQAIADSVRIVTNLRTVPFSVNGLAPAVNNYVQDNLAAYFYPRVADIAMIMHVLDEIKPKLVLLHNDVEPLLRAVALWARDRSVHCLHVAHSVILEHDGISTIGTDIHDLLTASHIAVAGPYQRDWYLARQGEDVCMTGLPQFDRLAGAKIDHQQACNLFKMDVHKPVVAYMSSWRQDTNLLGCTDQVEENYAAFLIAAKMLPELQYIVSCHPRGRNLPYHVEQAKLSGVRCAVTEQHLDVTLNAADIIITSGPSNVVLESTALGNAQLIVVGGGGFLHDPEIIKVEADGEQIISAIRQCLAGSVPDYRRFVSKYLGQVDGKASERIAAWAKELHDA